MIIKNVKIVTSKETIFGYVEIKNKKIIKIVKGKTELDGIDGKGNYLIPSYIDTHTHGGYGFSFNDLSKFNKEDLQIYLNSVIKEGISWVFATVVTDTVSNIKKFLRNYRLAKKMDKYNILKGLYLEGPFLSKEKKGAHNENLIIAPKISIIKQIVDKNVKILIVSPDYECAPEAVKFLSKKLSVSVGHSNASMQQTSLAIKNGANRITHLYNAMSGFSHREPGVVNSVFDAENLFIEIIADGQHVDTHVIANTLKLLSKHNKFLIVSDSLPYKGLPDGDGMLGSVPITKKGDTCFVKNTNTLAGSTMPYDKLVKTYFSYSKDKLRNILNMTSNYPAQSIGIKAEGQIKIGNFANLLIVNKNFEIKNIILQGALIK